MIFFYWIGLDKINNQELSCHPGQGGFIHLLEIVGAPNRSKGLRQYYSWDSTEGGIDYVSQQFSWTTENHVFYQGILILYQDSYFGLF